MPRVPYPPMLYRPIDKITGVGSDAPGRRTPVLGTVLHSMDNDLGDGLWQVDAYFRLPATPAGTDYGIGADGTVIRWLGWDETEVFWASGPARYAASTADGRRLLDRFGPDGVNRYPRSVEHAGRPGDPLPTPMLVRSAWLVAAIHATEAGQGAAGFGWNLFHGEICGYDYKSCPGGRFRDHAAAYRAIVVAIMAHHLEEQPYPARLPFPGTANAAPLLPVAGSPIAPPVPPAAPLFVPFPEQRAFTAVAGAIGRVYGWRGAPVRRRFRAGERVWTVGYYHGQAVAGDDRWLVTADPAHLRVHASGFRERIAG